MGSATLVGLDIGATSIRAVETRRGKDGTTVTNVGLAALPPGAVASGVVVQPADVTAALRQLWSAAKFRTKQVVLGVSNAQVVVREMTVTNLPRRELRSSLPYQVRDALPLPVEQSLLDFFPLRVAEDGKNVTGLLIAAPKEAVLGAVQAVERAKLRVVHVDLASFALLRAASRLDPAAEALVDIGAHSTSVVVHADGVPLIVRTIPRGGMQITEAIAGRLGVPPAEAEMYKCRMGLRPGDGGGGTVAEAVSDAVRPLLNEIRSSFAYLTSSERAVTVSRLTLSGGGSLLPGLVETLRELLGIEVSLADPTVRVREVRRKHQASLEQFRPSAAVSIGLTLGAA